MRGYAARSFLVVVTVLAAATLSQAAVVDVAVSADKPVIAIGETGTLTVFAEVKPAEAATGNGVFGWDVDLRIGDTDVLGLLPGTLDRSGWTGNAATSSSGTPQPWGIDAIYDTGESADDLGLGGPVKLFSVDYSGVSIGTSSLTVESDQTSGADFVTWLGNAGGDYSGASTDIEVTPEPATLAMLGIGSLLLARRRRTF